MVQATLVANPNVSSVLYNTLYGTDTGIICTYIVRTFRGSFLRSFVFSTTQNVQF